MLEIRHPEIKDQFDTQDAYNEIYRDQGILLRDSFYMWLIELLEPQKGKLLLDISCGEGRLGILAEQSGLNTIGFDFALAGVLKGKTESPQSGWGVGDGECLPLADQSVDYITHIGSLEHYIHPELGALEIWRVLKQGGRSVILVPNAFGLLGNVKYVLKTGDIFDDGQPLQRYGTRKFWEKMLTDAGLRVLATVGWNEAEFPRTAQDRSRMLRHPRKILRYLVNFLIPTNLTNHLVYICTRD